jgi:hypothetical protein
MAARDYRTIIGARLALVHSTPRVACASCKTPVRCLWQDQRLQRRKPSIARVTRLSSEVATVAALWAAAASDVKRNRRGRAPLMAAASSANSAMPFATAHWLSRVGFAFTSVRLATLNSYTIEGQHLGNCCVGPEFSIPSPFEDILALPPSRLKDPRRQGSND